MGEKKRNCWDNVTNSRNERGAPGGGKVSEMPFSTIGESSRSLSVRSCRLLPTCAIYGGALASCESWMNIFAVDQRSQQTRAVLLDKYVSGLLDCTSNTASYSGFFVCDIRSQRDIIYTCKALSLLASIQLKIGSEAIGSQPVRFLLS